MQIIQSGPSRATLRQAALQDSMNQIIGGLGKLDDQKRTERQEALQLSKMTNDLRQQGYNVTEEDVKKNLEPEQSGFSKWLAGTGVGKALGMEVQGPKKNLFGERTDEWKEKQDISKKDAEIERKLKQSQIFKNYQDAIKTGGGLALTKGQEAADKDYGKQYHGFASKGVVNTGATLNKLEAIANELENDAKDGGLEASGGTFAAFLPDFMRSSDAVRRRDDARNAANTTLKELFPGALSDAEREAAAQEYYNDKLGAAENAKIIRGKLAQLRQTRENEIAKARHFQEKGTLKGFRMSDAPIDAYQGYANGQSGSWENKAAAKDPAVMMSEAIKHAKTIPKEQKIKELKDAGIIP